MAFDNRILGERIKACRQAAGISQEKVAEQMYELQKLDEARKAEEKRLRHRKNVKDALLAAAVYIAYYLIGRLQCVHYEDASVMGWLFLNDWKYIDYLYGWLLSSNLFWYAAAVSVVSAVLGKDRFSGITAAAFGIGWILGELFGPNPEGTVLGQGHYGWVIWSGIFLAGIAAGIAAEVLWKRNQNG